MSPKTRIALTFLLVVLAVAIWGASQFQVWYDRSALGGSERAFAACLFMLAIALNLPGLAKRKKRHHTPAPDYYIHFDQPGHHAHPAHPAQPQHPAEHGHHPAGHPVSAGHGHPPAHSEADHQYDRRH